MDKKLIFLAIGLLAVISGVVIWLVKPFTKPGTETTKASASVNKIVNSDISIDQRPYITLEPKSKVEPKSLGHWVTLTVDNPGNFTKTEYEFEYTTGSMIQGGMGRIDFVVEKPPVAKEIAFGSESKGKYKYDEGVQGGKFIFHLFTDEEEALLKTDFNLVKVTASNKELTTPDGKATITLGKNDLANGDFVIIASTLGLPVSVPGEVLAGPYGFYTDSLDNLSDSTISFNQEGTVLYFDGQSWEEVTDGEIQSLGTFVLINK